MSSADVIPLSRASADREGDQLGAGPSTQPPPVLDSLFHQLRVRSQLAPVCFYFPVGLLLGILRFFICLHAFLVTLLLPKTSVIRCYILRVMCTVLGMVVVEEEKNRDPEVRVIVANHVSVVDHWLLDLLQPCVLPSVWDFPYVLNWGYIYKEFTSSTQPNVAALKAYLEAPGAASLLAFPEAEITNGSALMKFSQLWPFELGLPVQTIAIKAVRTPFRDLSVSTMESNWVTDLLWLFFSPWTTFRISRLPAVSRGRDESVEEFAQRSADMLANQLGVRGTPHTHQDKIELLKRRHLERLQRQRRAQEAQVRNNPRLVRMAGQVKEVLPEVPLQVIIHDLNETNSVDLTISRLVDGIVPYVPERQLPPQPQKIDISQTTCADAPLDELIKNAETAQVTFNTSAPQFGVTAEERFASYQERKARLIENARIKYIQKHQTNKSTTTT